MDILIVGYELEPRDEAQALLTVPEAAPTAKKKAEPAGLPEGVYLQKLKRAVISGAVGEEQVQYKPTTKGSPAMSVATFLNRQQHGDMDRPTYKLIGFDVKTFLKTVGADCSLPGVSLEFPYRLWGGHSEYWDIESLLFPSGASNKNFGLKELVALHLAEFEAAGKEADLAKAKKLFDKWPGPGGDAQRDHDIVLYFAERLGVFA